MSFDSGRNMVTVYLVSLISVGMLQKHRSLESLTFPAALTVWGLSRVHTNSA